MVLSRKLFRKEGKGSSRFKAAIKKMRCAGGPLHRGLTGGE